MAHVTADRVIETSASTGTGPVILLGALPAFRRFGAKMSLGDTCHYLIQAVDVVGQPTGEYEYGRGTYSAANTLTRSTVVGSSNNDAAVNFSVGTKQVAMTVLAPTTTAQIGQDWRAALGLGSVNNTTDAEKPLSAIAAVQNAERKAEAEAAQGSANDAYNLALTKARGVVCTEVGYMSSNFNLPFLRYGSSGSVRYLIYSSTSTVSDVGRQDGFIQFATDAGTVGVAYTPSDERLKADIAPAQADARAMVDAFEFISYRFKPDNGAGMDPAVRHAVGFRAQQLRALDKSLVMEMPVERAPLFPGMAEQPTDEVGRLMLRDPAILAYVAKAVQELSVAVRAQAEEIAALKARKTRTKK
jgi:hypothetical protein